VTYDPPRRKRPAPTGEPLEIDLVFNVRPCGTCTYFWPDDVSKQPYGPYPTYDFLSNAPGAPDPSGHVEQFTWIRARTQGQAFPAPEIMDGCRKAPIMTLGINPNLTAFAPGRTGTSWCYPHFTGDGQTDAWAKYAYYYRYRSVYQEHFDLTFVEQFLLPEPRLTAARAGIVRYARPRTDTRGYEITLRYDDDKADTVIQLRGDPGAPRWVLLFDDMPPNNRFAAGETIAARLSVPAGRETEVFRAQIGYYEQFVPTLEQFQETLRAGGHAEAVLRMGEDVCQLDMVACASPHWTPEFVGGTTGAERVVIDNCVVKNAWAVKQLVHTQPAVLFLVGESTWDMFRDAFGALVHRTPGLSSRPADGAFTLLRETTDPGHPAYVSFAVKIDGRPYALKTRLVVSPHFSYSTNFLPQWRLSPTDWSALRSKYPQVARLLQHDRRVAYRGGIEGDDFVSLTLEQGGDELLALIKRQSPGAATLLRANFYDAHRMMAGVLDDMYAKGELAYGRAGNVEALTRTDGACRFCVNDRWRFPLGCPYGKPNEPSPPTGWLEKVAAAAVAAGRKRASTGRG
jgi:hypothetical protein